MYYCRHISKEEEEDTECSDAVNVNNEGSNNMDCIRVTEQ